MPKIEGVVTSKRRTGTQWDAFRRGSHSEIQLLRRLRGGSRVERRASETACGSSRRAGISGNDVCDTLRSPIIASQAKLSHPKLPQTGAGHGQTRARRAAKRIARPFRPAAVVGGTAVVRGRAKNSRQRKVRGEHRGESRDIENHAARRFHPTLRQVPASHQEGTQGPAQGNQAAAVGNLKYGIAFHITGGQLFLRSRS